MVDRIDIEFTKTGEEYDISLSQTGDLATVSSLETAIDMSLLLDSRADSSEVSDPINRRGWWGDVYSVDNDHQTGIKDWLFDQARVTQNITSLADDYANQSLVWMQDNNIGEIVNIESTTDNGSLRRVISIKKKDNSVLSRFYDLWSGFWE